MIYKSIYLARRNPSVAPQDWPKVWRSHPRAVAQMGKAGSMIADAIETITYCARIYEPLLDGHRFDPPGVSIEHDGVALVSSQSEKLLLIGKDRTGQEEVIADEIRVFGRPADEFSLGGQEIAAMRNGPAPVAVIRFVARRHDRSPDAFAAWLAEEHADLAKRAVTSGKAVGFGLNLVTNDPPPGYEFDAVTEIWFASVEDALRSFAEPQLNLLSEDLAKFCEPERTVTMLTEVIFRVPRE